MPGNKPGTSQICIGSSRASRFLGIEGLGQSLPYWQLCSLLPFFKMLLWAKYGFWHINRSSLWLPILEYPPHVGKHGLLVGKVWWRRRTTRPWNYAFDCGFFPDARTKVHASCASSTSVRSRWSTFTSSRQSMTETESQWLFLLKSSVSIAWMLSAIWPVNHCVGSTVLAFRWDLQGWVMILRNTTLRNTWFPSITNC